ncbi:MAG: hypothetical protein ABT11_07625 [Novosphingobium sp. SCN 66-18]|nr:MAG: hypothetical protein ABT11_07625 [Novosphingobium sp. SCN 66-18]
MTEAFIYDHARTPRGRGREDGSLHEITSVALATQLLEAVRERNELDTALLDDVILGSAQPVGEQGGVLARAAVLRPQSLTSATSGRSSPNWRTALQLRGANNTVNGSKRRDQFWQRNADVVVSFRFQTATISKPDA